MSIFDSMYLPGGTGSGVGSGIAYTAGYRAFLEGFMYDHCIGSVLDVGCGDWQFSKLVNWGDRLYVGQDEVEGLIDRLTVVHGKLTRQFRTTLPDVSFDLVICKDVMIHLPNEEVEALLDKLLHHKHLLIVNDYAPPPNVDCERGHYRPLDITAFPFNLEAKVVYEFPQLNRETKVVHHRCAT
jgi:SAM-dependent methyltransferase